MLSRSCNGTTSPVDIAGCAVRTRFSIGYLFLRTISFLKDIPDRDDPCYIVTSCMFCNTADDQYFRHADQRGLRFEGMSQEELVEQRRHYVHQTRRSYKDF